MRAGLSAAASMPFRRRRASVRLHRLVVPAAVALVELIVGVDALQLVVQAAPRGRGAIGRDDDDVERGGGAVAERAAGKLRLDADHGGRRLTGSVMLALDRAAAGLGHAHRDLRFERMRACWQLVEIDGEFRLAGASVAGKSSSGCLRGRNLLVGEAELVAGKTGALLGHRDRHVAFEVETAAGAP